MPDQKVPEQSCLVEITQPYHVIHTLHGGGVHGPDGALRLLVDLVLLSREIVDIISKASTRLPNLM